MQQFARLREVGLDELFAMREVLEVPAAGWAATAASDKQLDILVESFRKLEQAVFDGTPPAALQEMLARSMETTLAITGRPARSVREHADIVDALLARDASRARAAARRHINSARRAAIARIASERAQSPSAFRT